MSNPITIVDYNDVMPKSYIDYSMSVIRARALPDARDGLKPVQRRILYAMNQLHADSDKPYRKSARITGDTMGKYHPHGDASIYDAIVVLAQDFKKNNPLVDGHGNFGSREGDGAAAARYTEVRLHALAEKAFLADLNNDTVDFVPNYDNTEKEPVVLPAKIPNLLLQGVEGIAVGMTTNIPVHNLGEVVRGEIAYIDSLDKNMQSAITTEELMQYVQGPDWPTGGMIINQQDLLGIYETGSGKIKVRGEMNYEPGTRTEKDRLVITSIPPTMVGAGYGKFKSDLVDLVKQKELPDVVDIKDTSDENIRIVIELKRGADVEKIKNYIYKKTKLEDTYSANFLAIKNDRPELLGLKAIYETHVAFALEFNERKYNKLLSQELRHNEILEGNMKAIDVIDLIIEIVRGSKTKADAMSALMGNPVNTTFKSKASEAACKKLTFTELQAQSILSMQLQRLIGLEILALQEEYKKSNKAIEKYRKLLSGKNFMLKAVRADLEEILLSYDSPRRTIVTHQEEAVVVKKEEEPIPAVFVMNRLGYAKLLDPPVFDKNMEAILADNPVVIRTSTVNRLMIFTDAGLLYQVKVKSVPFGKPKDKGTHLESLFDFRNKDEHILYVDGDAEVWGKSLAFISEDGFGKVVSGVEFMTNNRITAASKVNEGSRLLCVSDTRKPFVLAASESGCLIRFKTEELPEKKKGAVGNRVMKIADDEKLTAAVLGDLDTPIRAGGKTYTGFDMKLSKMGAVGVKKRG